MLKRYAHLTLSANAQQTVQTLREEFSRLDTVICSLCPPSRERSIALTELESAASWAIKGVVHGDPASTQELTDE